MTDDARPPRRDRAGFPPTRKSLGQHFLTDRRILGRIADALHLTGTETVLEIGPGRGALTDILVERAGRLIAIEYDRALAEILRQRYARRSNVLIAEADVLEVSLGELAAGPYVLIGNVPYYITTPILFHALVPPRAERSVYLVQKEVADRLSAAPGTKEYGALTVFTRAAFDVKRAMTVSRHSFLPPPDVTSAVVELTPVRPPRARETDMFRALVKAAFGMRRKTLRNCWIELAGDRLIGAAAQAGISLDLRGETLDVTDFARMANAMET